MTDFEEEIKRAITDPERAKRRSWRYLREDVLKLNFYRSHMLYFIIVILISSVIVYGEGLANDPQENNGSKLRYIDALFLCCSAMTTTGLNTVNLGSMTAFQQSWLTILLVIGTVPFVSLFVVVIRRHYFRKKLKDTVEHSRSGRKYLQDIEQPGKGKAKKTFESLQNGVKSAASDNTGLRRRPEIKREMIKRPQLPSYQTGHGFIPAPWELEAVQDAVRYPFRSFATHTHDKDHSYLSFKASLDERGRFRELSEHERSELGGYEYRATTALLWIISLYQVFFYALGTVILVPYAYRAKITNVLHTQQPGNLNPGWWGFFQVVTSFCNGGINILNTNFIPWQGDALILLTCGFLTVAGNTQFPIFLRFFIWATAKVLPKQSRLRQTLKFLLHHPRRCFIYLFPSKQTWYLFAIQFLIDTALWILFLILNLGLPAVDSIPANVRVLDGLFQSTGVRNSGAYIITISSLAPALNVIYTIGMYISSYPIVMALRQTNTYEERSIGLDKNETSGGLATHLRRQLAYDIWFQLLSWFLICIIERGKIVGPDRAFDVFSILFEVTSAYGTVGLSLGVPYDAYSLSGAFKDGSKVVMCIVMLRGRHRGLPLAIDRSILLPGEDLMRKMDEEYEERGVFDPEDEQKLVREKKQGLPEAGIRGERREAEEVHFVP